MRRRSSRGVTQAEYDAGDIGTIIDTRIKPALRDPATRKRFDALWSDISGGERPFVAEGVDIYYATLVDHGDRQHPLGDRRQRRRGVQARTVSRRLER